MKAKHVLGLLLIAVVDAGEAEGLPRPVFAELGEMIYTNLATAPFPHPARAEGHKYNGQAFSAAQHYLDSTVAIFIPKGFKPGPGETTDFVIHFHGWRARLGPMLDKFQLVSQFAASGRNAIFVAPQGPYDSPDSSGGKLEDTDGFKRFMDDVLKVVRSRIGQTGSGIGKITLSGHSGAYRVMAYVLDRGGLTEKINEVFLFDALYAETARFDKWIQRPGTRLVNIYTTNGGTKAETEKWMADLEKRGIPLFKKQEEEVTTAELKANRLVFLYTKLGHNEVLSAHQNFREYLRAGN
jgi:hypothetical protein